MTLFYVTKVNLLEKICSILRGACCMLYLSLQPPLCWKPNITCTSWVEDKAGSCMHAVTLPCAEMCCFSFSGARDLGKEMNQQQEEGGFSRQKLQPIATPGLKDVHMNSLWTDFTEQHVHERSLACRQPTACSRAKVLTQMPCSSSSAQLALQPGPKGRLWFCGQICALLLFFVAVLR